MGRCAARSLAARVQAATVCAFALAATASPFGSLNDLWWNPDESGWGVNVVEQEDTLFITIFTYGPDGAPRWYVAPETVRTSQGYHGALYATTGPWFARPFDANAVSVREVGSIAFELQGDGTAMLRYEVDREAVEKRVRRQFVREMRLGFEGAPQPSWLSYSGTLHLAEISPGCRYAGPYIDTSIPDGTPLQRFWLKPERIDGQSGRIALAFDADLVATGTYRQDGSQFDATLELEVPAGRVTYLPPGRYRGAIRPLAGGTSFVHGTARFAGDNHCYMGFAFAGYFPSMTHVLDPARP